MVTASHQSSEGCGFDPHLGLRNRFSKVNLSLMNVRLSFITKELSIVVEIYDVKVGLTDARVLPLTKRTHSNDFFGIPL